MNRAEIESLSGKELVALHNKLTGEDVKRFASHAAGVKRVLAAYNAQGEAVTAKPAKAPAKPAPKPESKLAPAAQPAATAPAVATPTVETPAPAAGSKAPRPGSKRERLLVELRKPTGLTLEQMATMFEWKPNDCRDALRLLRVRNGVNLRKDDDGCWKA